MTQQAKDNESLDIGLDIIVFVAHLELTTAQREVLIGRLTELARHDGSSQISLVVSDNPEFEVSPAVSIGVIKSSAAADRFRATCRVLEGAPRDVLISFGPYLPTDETIAELRARARSEEMVSAVTPRVAIGPKDEVIALGARPGSNTSGLIDSRYSPKLAPNYYLPEVLCPCMLIPAKMIGNVDVPDTFHHFPDLILAFLRAGRRRGLLVRIDNRLTVSADTEFRPEDLRQETAEMLQQFEDHDLAARRLAASPALADERRFQSLRRSSAAVTGSLLFDCANIPPVFSGSADHMLGVLKGMTEVERGAWDLAVMVADETRKFFSLDERFHGIRFASRSDDCYYDCAIRSSQPWSISEVADLNRRARSIAFTILDTIGTDTIYAVPEQAEEAFQFAAEHADGLIYISEFTRDQFARRFMRRPGLAESVIHLSLDPAEYVVESGSTVGGWILIFGNAYDHKDLERTTKIVSAAFPYERIKVVGSKDLDGLNVEAYASGALDSGAIEELFQRAKCMVFPSFYEGFGLPLLKGLACGKPVFARKSGVFREVVVRFPSSGRLIEFENSLDLVPALGNLLHSTGTAQSAPTSSSTDKDPYGWKNCAQQIFQFAEQMRKSEDVDVWRARDRALRYITAER